MIIIADARRQWKLTPFFNSSQAQRQERKDDREGKEKEEEKTQQPILQLSANEQCTGGDLTYSLFEFNGGC